MTVFERSINPRTGELIQTATDICDQEQARKYLKAPNAKVVRARKSGLIVEVHVKSHGDDCNRRSTGGGQSTTYEENIAEHPLVTLKIWTGRRFREWKDKDAFNPRRFNPDLIPRTAVEMMRASRVTS